MQHRSTLPTSVLYIPDGTVYSVSYFMSVVGGYLPAMSQDKFLNNLYLDKSNIAYVEPSYKYIIDALHLCKVYPEEIEMV